MISTSYREIRRYLEVTGRLGNYNAEGFHIKNSRLFIVPHGEDSLFNDISVASSFVLKDDMSLIYGVAHSDGSIYVQSLKKIKEYQNPEKIDNNLIFPKSLFVDIKKLIPNPDAGKFVHCHCHSVYSLADGMAKIEDYARACKQLGFPAIALTDHGTMAGVIEFYKKCKKFGVKPIIGQEFYFDDNRHTKSVPEDVSAKFPKENKKEMAKIYEQEHRINLRRHLILLAKNEIGLKNLYKLSSFAYTEGFSRRPRIDWELLEKYHEGIIASSACSSGIIAAEKTLDQKLINLRRLIKIFGKDFYLEVMLIQYEPQPQINDELFALHEKYNIPIIVTVDPHYLERDVNHVHQIYMQIGSGYTFGEGDNYLKTYSELKDTFDKYYSNCKYGWEWYEKAIKTTHEIADKCNVEIELGKFKLPKFELATAYGYQKGDTQDIYFRRRIIEGWSKKIQPVIDKKLLDTYKQRLVHELKTITEAGYIGYILVVLDIIDFCKKQGMLYNVRGSAAGSLVCYLLDVTRVDPIKRNLLFERFVSPLRAGLISKDYQAPADIDLDVPVRGPIIKYMEDKYGHDCVVRVANYSRFKLRAAFKQIAEITKFMTADEANKLSKKIPKQITEFKDALDVPEFLAWYKVKKNKDWFDTYVDPVLNLAGHGSINASGIIITPEPLINYMPVKRQEKKKEEDYDESDERLLMTQFEKDSVDDIGLLKFDILGVNTLNSLSYTKKIIKERRNIDIDYDKIDIDNPRWYKGFIDGDTTGIFQLDTDTSQKLTKDVAPENFKELMATVALSRPGTAGPGLDKEYCYRKRGKAFEYDHPLLKEVLKDTLGICIFQESLMQLVSVIAGFTLVEADDFRKIMKKKDHKKMQAYHQKFIQGAIIKGCTREQADDLYMKISSFSRYGFNLAHSCSYSQISVWGMAMKLMAPLEFYVGILECAQDKEYINLVYRDIVRHNIPIQLPDINISKDVFTIKDKSIVWKLSAAKQVGDESAKMIALHAPYKSISDLLQKVDKKFINKRVMDALISINAFGSIYPTQRDAAIDYYNLRKESLPLNFDIVDKRFWDGLFYKYLGFHWMDPYIMYANELSPFGKLDTYEEFLEITTKELVKIAGYITFFKRIEAKNGPMVIVKLDIDTHEVSIVIWNSFYECSNIFNINPNDMIGQFVYILGEKNMDPQGNDQVALGDSNNDRFIILSAAKEAL